MSDVIRITAEKARAGVVAGDTLLVCAYDSDEKFATYHLEGAVSLSEFKTKVDGLDKDMELVFYCA